MEADKRVVLGTMWGDEGKGKIVDFYSQEADVIVRCAGGANAGHTVYTPDNKKIILHQIPSGALHDSKLNLIGNGVVLDPITLVNKELSSLKEHGYRPNIVIDRNTHVILEYQKMLDAAIEKEKAKDGKKVGTTGKGIGPAYATKAFRLSVRFQDLVDEERLEQKLDDALPFFIKFIGALNSLPREYTPTKSRSLEDCVDSWKYRILSELSTIMPEIKDWQGDVPYVLEDAIKEGKKILFEGAQGALLDIDHGTYPMVTSSNSTIGGCITGTGMPIDSMEEIIGVAKAYVTRVGEGPFPTELDDEYGRTLQKNGNEHGATTNRPRRCGWQDLVALKYSADRNGLTGLAITKLDILDGMDEIKVCVAYSVDNNEVAKFLRDEEEFKRAVPVYKTFKGWGKQDWSKIHSKEEMPAEAVAYLNYIEDFVEVPIKVVSVGPSRKETIVFD